MSRQPATVWALLLCALSCAWCAPMAAAQAAQARTQTTTQTVWRCPAQNGPSVSYQSEPCSSGGHAMASTHTQPTAQARQASAQTAKREARLARTLARQRIRGEQNPRPAHTSLSGPVRQVSVGQRGDDRPIASKEASKRAARRASQQRRDVFRAEVPGRSRQQAQASASLP